MNIYAQAAGALECTGAAARKQSRTLEVLRPVTLTFDLSK